jgi:glycosyltransferase involved in cell wall biosynthesis
VRVLVVSGIWPPDPGGPASHASALAAFLHHRGHTVEVVTTADAAPVKQAYELRWVRRSLPGGVRHLRCVDVVRRRARHADVVYATSMVRRAALGTALARRSLVVKLVSDEVFERQQRAGRFAGTLEEFRQEGGARIGVLRWTRGAALRRANHVFSPSAYLRDIALGWGLDPGRISVLPNAAPELPQLASRDELRAELDFSGPTLVFAGRLGPQKALGVALEAVAAVPGVSFVIAGDGPDREDVESEAHTLGLDGRVRFLGAVSRADVVRLFRAADASLLSSTWENLPHSVLEALAAGTPVISTAVGGVPEVVHDGENGILVPPGDPQALADAIRRFLADDALRRRLADAAPGSVAGCTEESVFTRIEEELARVTG